MCGQIHVASIPETDLEELIAALAGTGFRVDRAPRSESPPQQHRRCARGDRALSIAVEPEQRDSEKLFVVVPHPPYSPWPWRWSGDNQFFSDLTDVIDRFEPAV